MAGPQLNPDLSIVRTVADLRAKLAHWRRAGQRIALVPTMGALHAGHLSLVQLATAQAERVVATIFVNPRQFGPREDLSRYPRQEADDARLLADGGCDLLFAPDVSEVYPEGYATTVQTAGITDILCGAMRPGHFDGVATVVTKLLNMALPDVAVFGEKDFQQLHVIRRVAADLNIGTQIIGAPLVRDADGLALSSRNAYLKPETRARALALPSGLMRGREALRAGQAVSAVLAGIRQGLLDAGFDSVDYVELRHEDDLSTAATIDRPARLLAAARIEGTRLIDNLAIQR